MDVGTGLSTRLTQEGKGALLFTAAVGLVAGLSGNNLLYLMLSVLVALWALGGLLGSANLRGLKVCREVPESVFANQDGPGHLVITRRGWGLPALGLEVRDWGTTAMGRIPVLTRGRSSRVAVRWRFELRGIVTLRRIDVASRFPLGWLEHTARWERPQVLLVYPQPLRGAVNRQGGSDGHAPVDTAALDHHGGGDISGLRPYMQGDRMSAIHWRTTARVGELMVAQRTGERMTSVVVRLSAGGDWETEIRRAAAAILGAGARGWSVGLEVPAVHGAAPRTLPVRAGVGWHRILLDTLARLPRVVK